MAGYQSAENLYPAFTEILVNRGNVFFLTRAFPDAIEQYSEALARQTPAAHISYINRGMCYEKLGDYSAAGDDYRQALKLVPGWQIAEQKLTRLDILKTGEIGHTH